MIMKEIKKFLANNLTKYQFDTLPKTLQVTPNLLTMMLKDPGSFELGEFEVSVKVIGYYS